MRIKNKCKFGISKLILSLLKMRKKNRKSVCEKVKRLGWEKILIYNLIVIVLINYLNSCMTIGTCTRL